MKHQKNMAYQKMAKLALLKTAVECNRKYAYQVDGYCQLENPPFERFYGGIRLCKQSVNE